MPNKSFLNIKPLTRKDKLTFGKYENHTIKWIIENDPGYIVWMSENIPYPIINKKIVQECYDGKYEYIDWEDVFFDPQWEWD